MTVITRAARTICEHTNRAPAGWWLYFDARGSLVARTRDPHRAAPHRGDYAVFTLTDGEPWSPAEAQKLLEAYRRTRRAGFDPATDPLGFETAFDCLVL